MKKTGVPSQYRGLSLLPCLTRFWGERSLSGVLWCYSSSTSGYTGSFRSTVPQYQMGCSGHRKWPWRNGRQRCLWQIQQLGRWRWEGSRQRWDSVGRIGKSEWVVRGFLIEYVGRVPKMTSEDICVLCWVSETFRYIEKWMILTLLLCENNLTHRGQGGTYPWDTLRLHWGFLSNSSTHYPGDTCW